MDDQQLQALAADASLDQLKAMLVTVMRAVVAADTYLNAPADVSGPNSMAKALTRAFVEEAMGLITPREARS